MEQQYEYMVRCDGPVNPIESAAYRSPEKALKVAAYWREWAANVRIVRRAVGEWQPVEEEVRDDD